MSNQDEIVIAGLGLLDAPDVAECGSEFIGTAFDRFLSEADAVMHLGPDYRSRIYERITFQSIVQQNFLPPSAPIGVIFRPIQIDEAIGQISFWLDYVANMREASAIYFEDAGDSLGDAWNEFYLDERIVIRHIPILRAADGNLLYHPAHLHDLLGFITADVRNAAIFARDEGAASRDFEADPAWHRAFF